jgi:hypothetical protein
MPASAWPNMRTQKAIRSTKWPKPCSAYSMPGVLKVETNGPPLRRYDVLVATANEGKR